MSQKWIAAALTLMLLGAVAGCGSTASVGAGEENRTAAYRNAQTQHWSGKDSQGAYWADEAGRVDGYHDRSAADSGLRRGEQDLKDAGEDLKNAAKNAGESIGHTAESALDQVR